MKKKISVNKRIYLMYGISGAAWLLYGVLKFITTIRGNAVLEVVQNLILVSDAGLVFYLFGNRKNTEEDDELSISEVDSACAGALGGSFMMVLIIQVVGLIVVLAKGDVLSYITFSASQVMDIVSGMLFAFVGLTELQIAVYYHKEEKASSWQD